MPVFRIIIFASLLCVSAHAATFESTDIGTNGGSTTAVGNDGFDILGGGEDIWWSADHFRYVYRKVEGDFDLSTNMISIEQAHEWTKGGLMVRQSLSPGSIHLSAMMAANSQIAFQRRLVANQDTENNISAKTQTGGVWLRVSRSGERFTLSMAFGNGEKWLPMGIMNIPLTDPVLVGFCVTSHVDGKFCKASFRNIKFSTDGTGPDIDLPPGLEKPVARAKPSTGAPAAPAEYVATDKPVAAALAAGAAKLAADGKTDKARELCFKSLANDENCAEALYELAKIFEKENNNTAAADFFVRASRELAQQADNPAMATKRADAERRVLKLNPLATRFNAIMADYASDLSLIVKKSKDTLTQEEVGDRIMQLRLPSILPPDKIPQISTQAAAAKTSSGGRPVATNVPPDVERALKAAGWDKVTGGWKKISENVYEVTNGKLETAKVNGAVQVTVLKGGSGAVKAFVRNSSSDYSGSYYSYASGYGGKIDGGSCKLYTPYNPYVNNTTFRPYMEREVNLPDAFPKNQLLVTVNESHLEIHVNGKREKNADYKISKDGPFVVEIEGTMTIESPMAKGQ